MPDVLEEINEMVVRDEKERQAREDKAKDEGDDADDHPGAGGNSGTMIVDATCTLSNIRYSQDVSLLNETRENAEKLLDVLYNPADGKKPRTYRVRAKNDYLKYARCRQHIAKMTRKANGKQLTYTAAVVKHFHRCFGHADIHALANQVIGNRILVPAIRNKIVVGDLGNRPDGRFKRTDRQRQHIGLLFFQIGTAAAASHLLELAAVQLIQLFSNCLIQFPQRKEFAVA